MRLDDRRWASWSVPTAADVGPWRGWRETAPRSANEWVGTLIVLVAMRSIAHEIETPERHTHILRPKGEGNMTPGKRWSFDSGRHVDI